MQFAADYFYFRSLKFSLLAINILHHKIGTIMSKVISIKLSDKIEEKLTEISKETEKAKSYHIQKAIEDYIVQFDDYQIALDRLNDSNDEIISAEEVKELLDK